MITTYKLFGGSSFCLLVLMIALPTVTSDVTHETDHENHCKSIKNCYECIQKKSCAWCTEPDIGDKPKCFQPAMNTSADHECPIEYTWNPQNKVDEDPSSANDNIVQFSPKRIGLELRISK